MVVTAIVRENMLDGDATFGESVDGPVQNTGLMQGLGDI